MHVVILSLDKTLLGEQVAGVFGIQGDTIKRHQEYGTLVDQLDIIVTAPPGFEKHAISSTTTVYSTSSRTPWNHFFSTINQIKILHKKTHIDLVVAQDLTSPAAWYIRKKYHIPYIVSFHGADFSSGDWRQKFFDRLLLPIIQYAVRKANGLRVVSSEIQKQFIQQGFTMPIEVIPTASDHTLFTKPSNESAIESLKKKYNAKKLILTNGRLTQVKNYPLLFDAFKQIQHTIDGVQLLIIGSGPLEKELKQKVFELGISDSVDFLGSMPYEDLVPYYQCCDMFVLASDSESLGKVLLHAGAAGKPVVATKTLGARGIIKDGETGLLVDIGNKNELVEKVTLLLQDEKMRKEMGERARKYVLKNYNAEKNIQLFVNFWKRITRES